MKRNLKSSLLVGLSAVALTSLAACGSENEAETPASTDAPIETSFAEPASVPEPTVTPNADPIETTHPNSIQPETTLSLSAEGSVNKVPDIAFLNTGVQTRGETAQAAMQANSAAMNGVFEALAEAGVERSDMQTSNFSLQPQYDYVRHYAGRLPDAWNADNVGV